MNIAKQRVSDMRAMCALISTIINVPNEGIAILRSGEAVVSYIYIHLVV
jgi:hypothetical protein